MVRRYWLGRIHPGLVLLLLALWSMIDSDSRLASLLPEDQAGQIKLVRGIAAIVILTFVAHLVIQLLASIVARLRIASVEIGVGRIVRRYGGGRGILVLRRYPVRLRLGWLPEGSVASARLRLALPHAAPLFIYVGVIVGIIAAPDVADRLDPRLRLVLASGAVLGLLAMGVGLRCESLLGSSIATLVALARGSSADIEDRYRPYTDRRTWSAYNRLLGAAMSGDRDVVRRRYEAIVALNPPAPMPALAAFHFAAALGDFSAAGRTAMETTRRDGSSRFAEALPSIVLAAKEARQPMGADVIEHARRVVAQYSESPTAFAMSIRAHMCAHDGDIDTAIAWAEAALRLETDPEVRSENMLVLAESYAARGRAEEAQSMLARARRIDRNSPRLPHVAQIVAEHLAQGRVALSL
jgi:hypothetical protein